VSCRRACRLAAVVTAAVFTVSCGDANKPDVIAAARRIEAINQVSAAAARLGASTILGRDVSAATGNYLRAVDASRGILPTRYLIQNQEVGLRPMSARIDAWCHPCARKLDQRARSLEP
jgi:hypothetical protein